MDHVGNPQLLSNVSLAVIVRPLPVIVAGVEYDFAHRLAGWGQDGIDMFVTSHLLSYNRSKGGQ